MQSDRRGPTSPLERRDSSRLAAPSRRIPRPSASASLTAHGAVALALAAALVAFALALSGGDARAQDDDEDEAGLPAALPLPPSPDGVVYPQAKIDAARFLPDGRLRLYVSVLDARRAAVPLAMLFRLVVEITDDESPGRTELPFQNGAPIEGRAGDGDSRGTLDVYQPDAAPRTKAELPVGLVAVYPSYIESPLGQELGAFAFGSRLNEQLRVGVAKLLDRLERGDLANVIQYGDWNWTYVPSAGQEARLRPLADRELVRQCALARRRALRSDPPAEPVVGAGLEELGLGACGLLGERDGFDQAIRVTANPGGYWPHLFGLRTALVQGDLPPGEDNPRLAEGLRNLAFEPRDLVPPAFAEALEMALRAPDHLDQRIVVLATDGRDGYLKLHDRLIDSATEECTRRYPELTPDELRAIRAGARTARQRTEALRQASDERQAQRTSCVVGTVSKLVATEQEDFVAKARPWLAMAMAGGVRVHAVGLVSDPNRARDFELERLRFLALTTGGTYREAPDAAAVGAELDLLAREINEQIIVELRPPQPTDARLRVRVVAQIDADSAAVASDPLDVVVPPGQRGGPAGLALRGLSWLESKVGVFWAKVIVITLGVLLLLLVLWLGFKVIKGIVKLLVKLAKGG